MRGQPETRRRGRPGGSQGADLLAVARSVFLEHGFAKTTMDTVAARARISKASLYQAHPSKDALFAATVLDWAARGRGAMRPYLDLLLAAEHMPTALTQFARTVQDAVLSPDVLRMRRLVAAEATRFPEVATSYVAQSWDRNIADLGDAFAELDRRGLIRAGDPLVAAQQFTWLAVAAPLNDQTLSGRDAPPEADRLDAIARAAVDTFLARYGDAVPRR
ncbi:TetR/AcrR family transcriptional regulator [Polymorphospora rubra]|uniref:Transcriptional regulator n=1 Tax=Polymorphospora rubra TaxID=338584 RepID=A0A810NFQ1_9ACTN|nr:TetR/AcrR family transcriptional regulator [Polymorphospora rubra]BCJ70273.1 transcriptional regulator [Polymorphospora rubra]